MLLSVERPFVGAFAFDDQGPRCCTIWSGANSPAGVGLEHCKRTIVVPQKLGITLFAPQRISGRRPGLPTPDLGGALVYQGANETSER